jgi:hypothetical protein
MMCIAIQNQFDPIFLQQMLYSCSDFKRIRIKCISKQKNLWRFDEINARIGLEHLLQETNKYQSYDQYDWLVIARG